MSFKKTIDKAIRAIDWVEVEYEDIIGKKHKSYKKTVEEAKSYFDNKKFPHTIAFNIKIDGVPYKKVIRD